MGGAKLFGSPFFIGVVADSGLLDKRQLASNTKTKPCSVFAATLFLLSHTLSFT
jgi:hypothetical protein